ncbi:class I SAM-dependent methyltransferase [Jatrophihabitans sp. YIM 134969]
MTRCRWCGRDELDTVLDLGRQPAADSYPAPGEPVETTPLRMGRCRACGLAQLLEDPGVREEPLGVEPAALTRQAEAAVAALVEWQVVGPGTTFVEFDSPHGGGWRELLVAAGAVDHTDDPDAAGVDLVVDVFGLMHDADQRAALERRTALLRDRGVIAVQFQPLDRIVELGQWNALRHGHMAYYSRNAITLMLRSLHAPPFAAREFALYGGTDLLVAHAGGDSFAAIPPDVDARPLAAIATASAADLHDWLTLQRSAGVRVIGYGAASRTTPLLNCAHVTADLLPLVVDASTGKQGRVIPGVDVPIGDPATLRDDPPDIVLLFLTDLLDEVRGAYPEVERSGGRWAVADPTVRLVPELPV